jgi:hypothetical protein
VLSSCFLVQKKNTKVISLIIPKRQHRFLGGSNAETILQKTGYSIELPSPASTEEQINLRGKAGDNAGRLAAMSLVMELAESAEVDTVSVAALHPGDDVHAANVLRYFARSRLLGRELPNQQIFLPTPDQVAKGQFDIEVIATVSDDFSRDAALDSIGAAKTRISELAMALTPDKVVPVHIDPLLYRHLRPESSGKHAKAVRALADKHSSLQVHWPKDAESGTGGAEHVLLVWTGDGPSQIPDVRSELMKIVAELGDIKAKQIQIPKKHHEAIRGPNDTTLNVLIGEDRNVAIKFGPNDTIEIRGPANDLPRVQKEIEAIAERAEREGVETSYVLSLLPCSSPGSFAGAGNNVRPRKPLRRLHRRQERRQHQQAQHRARRQGQHRRLGAAGQWQLEQVEEAQAALCHPRPAGER